MFKLELLYRDLSKFNEKMKLLGEDLHKYEIKDVMAKKDLLFVELSKECVKLNKSISRLNRLSWYKKWEKRLYNDPKFRDDS